MPGPVPGIGWSSLDSLSYLLWAAGPSFPRSSGLGRLMRTDFTTDFTLGEGSSSLGGWDRDLSVCWLPIRETSQDGSAVLDLPRLGSTTLRRQELLLLFFSSGG